jgi:putative ABC transport system permease protein
MIARTLARHPAFSGLVCFTLAVGLAASALIFSVIRDVLLEPLPYPESDRIVQIYEANARFDRISPGDPNFFDIEAQSRSFAALAQIDSTVESVSGGSEPVRARVAHVSAEFHEVIGVAPLLGRSFVAEEKVETGPSAALVSHAFWQRYLGGDPNLGSHSLRIGDRLFSVVGVMPPRFDYPDGAAVWAPREIYPVLQERTAHSWRAIGRIWPGVTLAEVNRELGAIARRLKAELGRATDMDDAHAVPLHDVLVGRVRPALWVLAAAAVLLLGVAMLNVMSLMMGRLVARERELGVRAALGASTTALARLFFAEAVSLALPGAIAALVMAQVGLNLVVSANVAVLPRADSIRIDSSTAGFALGLALLLAVTLSGLLAWRASSVTGSAGANRPSTVGRVRSRWRGGVLAMQIALATVVLIGAALLGRSFVRAANVDPGFAPEELLLVNVASPRPPWGTEAWQLATFNEELMRQLSGLPGVRSVGGTTAPPLTRASANGLMLELERLDEIRTDEDFRNLALAAPDRGVFAQFHVASEDYFSTFGIPLLRGRVFDGRDGPDAPHVAVVSRSLAERRWPGEDPIGKWVQFGNMDGDLTPFTIVGVVADVREFALEAQPRETFYAFYRQRPRTMASFWIGLRAADPERLVPAVRRVLAELDPGIPPDFRTGEQLVAGSLLPRRFVLTMVAVFGAAALLLSLAGVYGAMAFDVAQRRGEIGVRMALGARPAGIVMAIVKRNGLLTLAGVVLGLLTALALARVMESLLYAVSIRDPFAYVGTGALVVLAAAATASWPALRAARVDPTESLRHE